MNIKKAVFFLAILAGICTSISSCKKCYSCAYYGRETEIWCAKDYTSDQLSVFDTACIHNGGVWTIHQQ